MLTHIDIKNFITIRQAHISMQQGLTVVTGDTGAGKSLFIGAIQFGLGHKSSLKNDHASQTQVSLTFDISALPEIQTWLKEQGFDEGEDECLLSRSLTEKQRSRCTINQMPTTLSTLKALGEQLLDIHGQHDSYLLLKNDQQRQLLDLFCADPSLPKQVTQCYQQWHLHEHALKQAQQAMQQQKDQQALLQYQLEELQPIDLDPENLARLDQKQKTLANAETLALACQRWQSQLEGDHEQAVLNQLQKLLQNVSQLSGTMPNAQAIAEQINQAIIGSEEAVQLIQDNMSELQPNPEALAETDALLGQLQDLARKHHVDWLQLAEKKSSIEQTLATLNQSEAHFHELEAAVQASLQQYHALASKLTSQRQDASKRLANIIAQHMEALNFLQAKVQIVLQPDQDNTPKRYGLEQVSFEMSTNPGQPLQPLKAVASGGELSRISLAIQMATCDKHTLPTLIFDEIDVGIGGKTAEMVGKQLRDLGANTQVICITHLAQVASQGHQHLCVQKAVTLGKTHTALAVLSPQQRIEEIARMVGGIEITDKTLAHAEAMLAID